MTRYAHIDIETFSCADLKRGGVYRYAEDPTTEVLCIAYSFNDGDGIGPVNLWVPLEDGVGLIKEAIPDIDGELHLGMWPPHDLEEHILEGRECRAWNAQFERTILNGRAGKAIAFPSTSIEQWNCTAAKAAAHALPRALGNAAKALGTHNKDEFGKSAMLALCKPRTGKVKRYDIHVPGDAPKYKKLFEYCADDVRAEEGIDAAVPELSPGELRAYHLDQLINLRGVKVDLPNVNHAINIVKAYRTILGRECKELTGFNPSQTEKLGVWIRSKGYDIQNLQAPTIKEALADPECTAAVRKVLLIRSLFAMKAVDKYTSIHRAVCEDQRLHGMFLYHGASTGRWSSLIVQLQNLFRPHKDVDPDAAIDAFEAEDLEWLAALFSTNPMVTLASCIRGMLIPDLGMDLYCIDFSQIEARVIAWFAGQQDVLDVFIRGEDIYKHTASKIYGTPIAKVPDEQRFIGKVATLALGFQGGKVAFAKMAKQYGQEISETLADKVKRDWREANPHIVRLWYEMEEAAISAVAYPGEIYKAANGKILFKVEGRFLYMRLPSGRRLAYLDPRIVDGKLTFMGVDTYTSQWTRCKTYGGKLVENAVQAAARDLLLWGMFNLEDAGYPVIGTVHDEVLLEVPREHGSLADAEKRMCDKPVWAEGIPVAADGFVAQRYRK